MRRHNPLINWTKNTCVFHSGYCQSHCLLIRLKSNPLPPEPKLARIALISRVAFSIAITRPGAECFVIVIIAPENNSPRTAPNYCPGQESGLTELCTQLVPPEYYDYLSIFSEEEAKDLPPHHYIDHAIPLIAERKPFSDEYIPCQIMTRRN